MNFQSSPLSEDAQALIASFANQPIKALSISDDEIMLTFEGAKGLIFWDEGQQCCERRFMRTDDDLDQFKDARFIGAELLDGPTTTKEDLVCDIQFLVIKTDRGNITMSSHNEHNGYYSGFEIEVLPIDLTRIGDLQCL